MIITAGSRRQTERHKATTSPPVYSVQQGFEQFQLQHSCRRQLSHVGVAFFWSAIHPGPQAERLHGFWPILVISSFQVETFHLDVFQSTRQRHFFARPLRIRGKALESPPEEPTFRYLVVHGRVTTAQEWTKRGGLDPFSKSPGKQHSGRGCAPL